MYWTSSSGRIELNITLVQAQRAAHQGQCDEDVLLLSKTPTIARQFRKLDATKVMQELKEYGAWDAKELADHEQNLQRLLWLACCDLVEECNRRDKA